MPTDVQISLQAVTPKPNTETYLKLNLEHKKRVSKEIWRVEKQHTYVIIFLRVFHFFMTCLIHSCQKRAFIPLKFEIIIRYDIFHGTKLSAWRKVSPIDGAGRYIKP